MPIVAVHEVEGRTTHSQNGVCDTASPAWLGTPAATYHSRLLHSSGCGCRHTAVTAAA